MTLTKSGSVEYAATPLSRSVREQGDRWQIDIDVVKLLRGQRAILTIRNLMIADLVLYEAETGRYRFRSNCNDG